MRRSLTQPEAQRSRMSPGSPDHPELRQEAAREQKCNRGRVTVS